jgi:hypothetical protein
MADPLFGSQERAENPPAGSPPEQKEARLTPFAILKGIIARPRATFTRLRGVERGHWWFALLLGVLAISLLSYATVHAETSTLQGFVSPSGAYGQRPGGFTPRTTATPTAGSTYEQTDSQTASAAQPSTTGGYVVPLVSGVGGVILGYLFCSSVVFSMSIVFGGKATYTQTFRMVLWASLPWQLATSCRLWSAS